MSTGQSIIIGSGPAGLAAAVCLQRRGCRSIVLERDREPSAALRSLDSDMHLVSPRRLSMLPFMPRLPGDDVYVAFGDYVATLDRYRRAHGVDVVTGADVVSVSREGRALVVSASDGRRFCGEAVISATGSITTPHLPDGAGALAIESMHSRDVRREHLAKARALLVVGGGTSASGVLALWADARARGARAWLSVRTRVRSVPRTIGGVDVHYLAWLPEKVPTSRLQRLRRFAEPGLSLRRALRQSGAEVVGPVSRYDGAQVVLTGRSIEPDLVVFATGYRYACDHLGHVVELDDDGYPRTDGCVSRRDPDVYLLGLRLSRNFASGFLRGIANDAAVVARRIAERSSA